MPDPSQTDEISPEETRKRIASDGERVRLVDCREDDEFAICQIDGAELIPLSRFGELAVEALGDDHDQEIIVYCHHGIRSLQATHFLRSRGYRNTLSMQGGIDGWADRIDPQVPRY